MHRADGRRLVESELRPSLLVAYPFVRYFLRDWPRLKIRSWVMDSGAYSVLTSGLRIDINRYIDDCLKLLAADCSPESVFGLDVIGDPEATLRNVETMHARGVQAIPTLGWRSRRMWRWSGRHGIGSAASWRGPGSSRSNCGSRARKKTRNGSCEHMI
jgi:hypothetical protein